MNIFELNKTYTVYDGYGAEVGTLEVHAAHTQDGVDDANGSLQALVDWVQPQSLPRVYMGAEFLTTLTDDWDGEQYLTLTFHKYTLLGYTLLDSDGESLNVQEFDDFCDGVSI